MRRYLLVTILLGVTLAVSLVGVAWGESEDSSTSLSLDNLVLPKGSYFLEFVLTPNGSTSSQPFESTGDISISVTAVAKEAVDSTGWMAAIKNAKEEVVFRIAGPYPPQQLSSYNEFFVSSPGLIDSAKADSPIGHLDYPRSGVHFFFESELPEVSADSPYSATLWIDGDGDGLDQPAETRVLNVNLVGRVVKTEASLPMFSGIRSFRVDIVAGSATAAQLLGDWDFEGNLPLKTDSTKIPYPLFFGFQPIQGSGSFQLPNLFPQINQSVLTGVVVEGVTWAVRIGPRLDITPTITPSPVQPVTATPSPMPTDSGKPPIIKPLWLWMGGIAGVVLLGALLVGWWLSKRQRREDGFSV